MSIISETSTSVQECDNYTSQRQPSNHAKQNPSNHAKQHHPSNHTKQLPGNHAKQHPSNHTLQGSSNHAPINNTNPIRRQQNPHNDLCKDSKDEETFDSTILQQPNFIGNITDNTMLSTELTNNTNEETVLSVNVTCASDISDANMTSSTSDVTHVDFISQGQGVMSGFVTLEFPSLPFPSLPFIT